MSTATAASAIRFPIRVGPRSRLLLLLLFGVRERNSYVELAHDEITAHFGWYHMATRLDNIERWRIEGPWLWITAIGVRRGFRYGDISFGGNHKAGVRLDFRSRVRWKLLRVPRLYVSVADLVGLGAALASAGISGEDAREPTA